MPCLAIAASAGFVSLQYGSWISATDSAQPQPSNERNVRAELVGVPVGTERAGYALEM